LAGYEEMDGGKEDKSW